MIHQGQNSGFQALNIAYLRGADPIILLGFDMKRGPKGESHHHGDHPAGLNNPPGLNDPNWGAWRDWFDGAAAQLAAAVRTVINCTPGSALDCFPKMDLEDALRCSNR